MGTLRQRLLRALTTAPNRSGWVWSAAVFCVFGAVAAAIGVPTGFLRLAPAALPVGVLLETSTVLLLHPSFTEEILFRAVPIPHPGEGASTRRTVVGAALGIVLFMASHPANGLIFRPAAFAVFTNPVFLVLTGLLGLACSVAYVRSGSIWPAVLLHWLVVNVWIFLLGGARLLTL
jgi:uncharacterized protein